jgi:hypothetical protein
MAFTGCLHLLNNGQANGLGRSWPRAHGAHCFFSFLLFFLSFFGEGGERGSRCLPSLLSVHISFTAPETGQAFVLSFDCEFLHCSLFVVVCSMVYRKEGSEQIIRKRSAGHLGRRFSFLLHHPSAAVSRHGDRGQMGGHWTTPSTRDLGWYLVWRHRSSLVFPAFGRLAGWSVAGDESPPFTSNSVSPVDIYRPLIASQLALAPGVGNFSPWVHSSLSP